MADEKYTAKKLPCGGYGIYGVDPKTKQIVQIGYIGANLNLEAFLPQGTVLQK